MIVPTRMLLALVPVGFYCGCLVHTRAAPAKQHSSHSHLAASPGGITEPLQNGRGGGGSSVHRPKLLPRKLADKRSLDQINLAEYSIEFDHCMVGSIWDEDMGDLDAWSMPKILDYFPQFAFFTLRRNITGDEEAGSSSDDDDEIFMGADMKIYLNATVKFYYDQGYITELPDLRCRPVTLPPEVVGPAGSTPINDDDEGRGSSSSEEEYYVGPICSSDTKLQIVMGLYIDRKCSLPATYAGDTKHTLEDFMNGEQGDKIQHSWDILKEIYSLYSDTEIPCHINPVPDGGRRVQGNNNKANNNNKLNGGAGKPNAKKGNNAGTGPGNGNGGNKLGTGGAGGGKPNGQGAKQGNNSTGIDHGNGSGNGNNKKGAGGGGMGNSNAMKGNGTGAAASGGDNINMGNSTASVASGAMQNKKGGNNAAANKEQKAISETEVKNRDDVLGLCVSLYKAAEFEGSDEEWEEWENEFEEGYYIADDDYYGYGGDDYYEVTTVDDDGYWNDENGDDDDEIRIGVGSPRNHLKSTTAESTRDTKKTRVVAVSLITLAAAVALMAAKKLRTRHVLVPSHTADGIGGGPDELMLYEEAADGDRPNAKDSGSRMFASRSRGRGDEKEDGFELAKLRVQVSDQCSTIAALEKRLRELEAQKKEGN